MYDDCSSDDSNVYCGCSIRGDLNILYLLFTRYMVRVFHLYPAFAMCAIMPIHCCDAVYAVLIRRQRDMILFTLTSCYTTAIPRGILLPWCKRCFLLMFLFILIYDLCLPTTFYLYIDACPILLTVGPCLLPVHIISLQCLPSILLLFDVDMLTAWCCID